MNVDQRPGREGRKPPKAGRDADGILILESQINDRGRMPLQSGNQSASDLIGKRLALISRRHLLPLISFGTF